METRQEITINDFNGKPRVIKRVSWEEAERLGLKRLGSGFGFCLEYCAWLGSKYQKNFFEKADYFVILKEFVNENYKMKKFGNCLNEMTGMTVAFFQDINKRKEEKNDKL